MNIKLLMKYYIFILSFEISLHFILKAHLDPD